MMMAEKAEHAGGMGLWYGLVAGIAFWGAHVAGMAAITPYVCHSGQMVWYHVLTFATLAPTAAALIPTWAAWRDEDASSGVRFLGGMGLLLTAIFGLAIIAEYVPVFIFDPCAA